MKHNNFRQMGISYSEDCLALSTRSAYNYAVLRLDNTSGGTIDLASTYWYVAGYKQPASRY